MGLYRGPFGGGDGIDSGITQRAVWHLHMGPQDPIQLGTQPFDGTAALLVEAMGAELDRDGVQRFKGMMQHQELAFGVEPGTLHRSAIPRGADFQPLVAMVDVHIGGHADGAGIVVENGKGHHAARLLQRKAAVDFYGHLLWRGYTGVPKLAEVAIGAGLGEILCMGLAEWLQAAVLALEGNGRCPHRFDCLF